MSEQSWSETIGSWLLGMYSAMHILSYILILTCHHFRYNGTPRGLTNCNEGGCIRCNNSSETSDECVCLHAEENALLEAGRDRVGDGSVLYCNTFVIRLLHLQSTDVELPDVPVSSVLSRSFKQGCVRLFTISATKCKDPLHLTHFARISPLEYSAMMHLQRYSKRQGSSYVDTLHHQGYSNDE